MRRVKTYTTNHTNQFWTRRIKDNLMRSSVISTFFCMNILYSESGVFGNALFYNTCNQLLFYRTGQERNWIWKDFPTLRSAFVPFQTMKMNNQTTTVAIHACHYYMHWLKWLLAAVHECVDVQHISGICSKVSHVHFLDSQLLPDNKNITKYMNIDENTLHSWHIYNKS